MVAIRPFRAIHFDQSRIPDLTQVVTPPYDTISEQAKDGYYQRHPYNVIRLILGKPLPGDDLRYNRFTRATDYLHRWLQEGILREDPTPAIYLSSQDYRLKEGESRSRLGFIALVRLEEFGQGKIFPHEITFPQPKQELLQLGRTCRANLSQIFALYSDPHHHLQRLYQGLQEESTPPFLHLIDEQKVRHVLWAIRDPERIRDITAVMADKSLLIADGHHRYETALELRDELRAQAPRWQGEEPANFVMMYVTEMEDPGLTILPTHRLIRAPGLDLSNFLAKVDPWFHCSPIPASTPERQEQLLLQHLNRKGEEGQAFGLYAGRDQAYLLTRKVGKPGEPAAGLETVEGFEQVDVLLLHSLLLEKILREGMGVTGLFDDLFHTNDEEEAFAKVRSGDYQLAIFLNPLQIRQLQRLVAQGVRLPPKSTFFYPKLLSGLLMRKLV